MKAIIIYEGKTLDDAPDFRLGDFGELLTFHVLQEDGQAIDLTSKTVKLKAKKLNDFNEHLFEATCNITDATAGYCEYEFISTDLDELGSFSLVLEVTEAAVIQSSIDLGYLNIRDAS